MQKISLNRDWRFSRSEQAQDGWRNAKDAEWQTVHLPHDWSIGLERGAAELSGASNGFFPMGRGFYTKTIDAPEAWKGKQVLVEFEGVYMNAEVWLNENYLGRHPYGYTTFTCDLTPYLKTGAANTLKVSVDNRPQLNSRWYSGSGIYRPVWLYLADPVHVAHWGVYITTPRVAKDESTVRVATKVSNRGPQTEITLVSRVLAPDGSLASKSETQAALGAEADLVITQEMAVKDARLWSPDAPLRYTLESEIWREGRLVDSDSTPFGIRSIQVSAEQGFVLNGQPLKLKGGCVHHDNGILGAASFARSEERKVEIHKASGFNAIRTAHNPPSPAFLDACDRLGMLVMDEAFDCWREGKNPGDYHLSFDDWWQRDVASMVLRDRNHPSVVFWSIGNEVMERDGRSGGYQIAARLAAEVRRLDPTRPVTSAICGVWDESRTWNDTDGVFASLDVGGYNYQWRQYLPDHERVPGRVMAGTESIPMESFENWMSVLENAFVIGDFVWTSLDYLGESGIGRVHYDEGKAFLGEFPWHISGCGDLDLTGFKRPQSYYRDMLWGSGAPLYIAVHAPAPEGKTPTITYWGWPDVSPSWTWPGREGQSVQVDIYSACEMVELYLNGKSLGAKPTTKTERFTASFDVPYEPGTLKAVGFAGGKIVAELDLRTAGEPERLALTADRETITSAEGDLAYVTVDVLDAEGCRHPSAERLVKFTVSGVGEIQAVGNANPLSKEKYQGTERSTYQGRCLVVLRPAGEPGTITLRADSEGLKSAEATILVK